MKLLIVMVLDLTGSGLRSCAHITLLYLRPPISFSTTHTSLGGLDLQYYIH